MAQEEKSIMFRNVQMKNQNHVVNTSNQIKFSHNYEFLLTHKLWTWTPQKLNKTKFYGCSLTRSKILHHCYMKMMYRCLVVVLINKY